jgi:prepilin-type N-terminal cleavage/methylation domain-containing protein
MKFDRKHKNEVEGKTGNRNNSDGFTILEVVFSISIFAIGMLGVCALQTAAIRTISSANYITEGTTNAQDKLEELMELPFAHADLDVGDHTDPSPPAGYTVSWTVADATTTTKQVAVTSTWQNINGLTVNSQLNFIKYDW